MFRGSVLVLAIIALAACAPLPSASVSSPSTPGSEAVVATGGTPAVTPFEAQVDAQSGGPAITLIRSGGLAGKVVQWDIYLDGRVVSSSGKEEMVPDAEVTRVISDIEKLGFYELAEPGGKNNSCADCFLYKLTVRDGGKERTLAFTPEATGTPAELLQMMEKLNLLLQALPKE